MPAAFCSRCGKKIGGFMQPTAWRCPTCRKAYCEDCAPKVGTMLKKPACPEHGIQLIKG